MAALICLLAYTNATDVGQILRQLFSALSKALLGARQGIELDLIWTAEVALIALRLDLGRRLVHRVDLLLAHLFELGADRVPLLILQFLFDLRLLLFNRRQRVDQRVERLDLRWFIGLGKIALAEKDRRPLHAR
jgi:hypothetical protein